MSFDILSQLNAANKLNIAADHLATWPQKKTLTQNSTLRAPLLAIIYALKGEEISIDDLVSQASAATGYPYNPHQVGNLIQFELGKIVSRERRTTEHARRKSFYRSLLKD